MLSERASFEDMIEDLAKDSGVDIELRGSKRRDHLKNLMSKLELKIGDFGLSKPM